MSLPALVALVAWATVVLALSALALPLAAALFPDHPDRGAALAPPLAVGTLALTGYWVGQYAFGRIAAVAGVVVLASLSALAWRQGSRLGRRDLARLRAPAIVFTVAFLGLLTVRYLDPLAYPQGGEKFLDFGLLAVLQRTDVLPPEDMWFAGETVRYYYAGPLTVTLLSDLAHVPPRYAYNLGLATFYAMLATAVYGLATAIADAHGDRDPRLAGVVAAFFVALAGRLATPVRWLAAQLPREYAIQNLEWVVAGIRMSPADAYATFDSVGAWSYWTGRYVVPDALHVFPSWAFLNGDLHAHLIATPYLVLAAASALAASQATGRRRLALLFGVLPATAGLLGLTSTWSMPTAIGLTGLALALTPTHPLADRSADSRLGWLTATRFRAETSRFLAAGLASGGVALLAAAWAYPFLRFQRPDSRGIGLLPPGGALGPLLLAHGIFLTLFAWAAISRWRDSAGRDAASRTTMAGIVLLGIGFVAATLVLDVHGVLLFLPVIVLGWVARRRGASDAATLAVAGAGILLVAELAYAKVWPHSPSAPRWNTIYKISMQAFVLWGTAAGVVFARKLTSIRAGLADRSPSRRTVARVGVAVLILASAATFPMLAFGEHVGGVATSTDHSLSATEYVDDAHPDEAAAIRWLRDDVSGTPTIVTAPGEPMYTWVSAPSSLTGVPTVVGWRHEAGYRGKAAYDGRVQHVETIYEADWPAAARLLDYHDVEYVYVGPVERERYEIRRFAARPGVDIAHRSGTVTIYAIDADRACGATNLTCPAG